MRGCLSNDSMTKNETKADMAFRIFDENKDGYVTKQEMRKISNLTRTQVSVSKRRLSIIKSNSLNMLRKLNIHIFFRLMPFSNQMIKITMES